MNTEPENLAQETMKKDSEWLQKKRQTDNEIMNTEPVLRVCAAVDEVPKAYVKSEQRHCQQCGTLVWYTPEASIPTLGEERILCMRNDSPSCFQDLLNTFDI